MRLVRRLEVRCLQADGKWGVGVLVGSITDQEILRVAPRPAEEEAANHAVPRAPVALDGQRGVAPKPASRATKEAWG